MPGSVYHLHKLTADDLTLYGVKENPCRWQRHKTNGTIAVHVHYNS